MECKYCHTALEEGSVFCDKCGMRQEAVQEETPAQESREEILEEVSVDTPVEAVTEEAAEEIAEEAAGEAEAEETAAEAPAAPGKKLWIKITAIACCLVLLLGLGVGVWYGINGGLAPRENNVNYKDNYTVENDKIVKHMDKVVATVGDAQLTNGQLQVYYWMQIYNFLQNYSTYLSYFGLDYTEPLAEQWVVEGDTTWEQYFLELGLDGWHRFQALMLYAQAEGFTLPDSVKEYEAQLPDTLQTSAEVYGYTDVNEMLAEDMGPGCDLDDYVSYMVMYAASVEYMDHLYADMVPTEEEIKAYVTENAEAMETNYGVTLDSGDLVDVRHILLQPENCEFDDSYHVVATEDQWEACRVQAQALLDQWKAGTADEESFAALAMSNSVDGSASSGGLYTDVYVGQMVENFENWCFDESRQTGDTGLVRTEFGYHIMYFVGGQPGWLRYGAEAYLTDACNAVIEEAMQAYPMEVSFKDITLGSPLSLVTEETE